MAAAGSDICALGTKALIVTGQSMIKQGFMKVLTDILEQNGVGYVIDSKISGEPTDVMIEEGLLLYQENACDFIIGFGGGSPLDSAKAIGAMVTNPGKISDYNGKVIQNPIPPLAAIPSTAGTGSEVTQFTDSHHLYCRYTSQAFSGTDLVHTHNLKPCPLRRLPHTLHDFRMLRPAPAQIQFAHPEVTGICCKNSIPVYHYNIL